MSLVHFGPTAPEPRPVSGGWAIPLGVATSTDEDGNTIYSAHEVVALTLFYHDITNALADAIAAGALPDADYQGEILAAVHHGVRLQRAAEYPPASDYLDGIAKGDDEQVGAYKAACLAVKEAHPFPSLAELTQS